MRVAVAQLDTARDAPGLRGATDLVLDAVERAAGAHAADVVVLPEYASGWAEPVDADLALPDGGDLLPAVRDLAARLGVAVVLGLLIPTAEPGRAHNVTVVVGADGDELGRYTKVHLYDAYGARESDVLDAGDPATAGAPLVVTVATAAGSLRLGVVTCYDLRFPESVRALVDADGGPPDVVAVGAAWAAGEGKADQLRVLARARAIESTAYVALASQSGAGRVGGSAVVDPRGIVLSQVSDDAPTPAIAVADVDLEQLAAVRSASPVLAHRRYGVHPLS
ncbi:hydrolase [Serinibacter arcticus]|uniref:Hydrolase n=1 Tax=Serinibacter arcticus TaxID=1655435 RepID=A0A2U1ZYF0_9MICO|nr:nitrilase-related carbon-nitrogen hydrolase [Serinibacter arcticus]PWD52009.1 hydrolase [Serinibacter arcticus]